MPGLPPIVSGTPSGLAPGAIDALAEGVTGDAPIERMQALRTKVLEAGSGHVPARARQEYSAALTRVAGGGAAALRASVDGAERTRGAIGVERKTIRGLGDRLGRIEKDNEARYAASKATLQAVRDQYAAVFVDRRASENRRVEAFFGIANTHPQESKLDVAWKAYGVKQTEFKATLAKLQTAEAALDAPSTDDLAAAIVSRQTQLNALLENLKAQTALLETMVAHASGTSDALKEVQAALKTSLAEATAFVDAVRAESATDLLDRVLGLSGFIAGLAFGPAGATVASIANLLREIVVGDVAGAREEAERLVWGTVGRLVTSGLVDAGVSETWARLLVGTLRETAKVAAGRERADASALVTAVVRAGLGEAQRQVIDFLLKDADEALPLASLVRDTLAATNLNLADAGRIIDALRHPTRKNDGVDAALARLAVAVA